MTESEERAYGMGHDAALRIVLATVLQVMPQGDAERWRLERGAAVAQLRSVCEDFGDNDWPDDLHLADVIEKHLARQLHDDGRGDDVSVTVGELKQWLAEYPDRVMGDLVACYLDARRAKR